MTRIFVTWQAPGFHHWPAGEGARRYLAHRHRHVFHFWLELDVLHDDREIEFHDLLDLCREQTPDGRDYGASSCEAIGHELMATVNRELPGRRPTIMISEDGECGATVS